MADDVSPEDPFERKRVRVQPAGRPPLEMAYVDEGEGEPVVFLHGNPTSSYLWRNVIPHVRAVGRRCVAPDLVGMGDSEPLPDPGPGTYSFFTHQAYLDAFLDAVVPSGRVTLVLHDWGSALGFAWAERNRVRTRGIAFTEAIVAPLTWADWPQSARSIFRSLRGPEGTELVLEKNAFVELILPAATLHLAPEAHDRYRAPFRDRERRWPTLEWPRQIPIENVPPPVRDVVARYGQWLRRASVPKLYLNAEPGSILVGRQRAFVRKWAGLTEVTVRGSHFVPEDSPHEIGRALSQWLPTLG